MVLMGTLAGPAWGTDVNWVHDPNTSGDWNDPNNWNPSEVPASGDNATINNGGTVTIVSDANSDVGNFYLKAGNVEQESGELVVLGDAELSSPNGSQGVYTLIDGSLRSQYFHVGHNGRGLFNQYGGTNVAESISYVGCYAGDHGTANLIGGSFSAPSQYVSFEGTGTFNQSGGINTAGKICIGYQMPGKGTYNISGGLLDVHTGQIQVGLEGEGALAMMGGTVEVDALDVAWGLVHVGKDALVTMRGVAIGGDYDTPLLITTRFDLGSSKSAYIQSTGESDSNVLLDTSAFRGCLTLDLQTGTYRPNQGDTFHLMVGFNSVDGTFDTITTNLQGWLRTNRDVAINLSDPNTYRPIFSGAVVDANGAYDYVATFQGARPGDASGDNRINSTDLAVIGAHWMQSDNWLDGDFNGDGIVNGTDLAALGANWMWTGPWPGPAPAGDAPLPEPATLALLSLGGLAMIRRKHR
jgi:hypothetical protein